jgi:GST-like protein
VACAGDDVRHKIKDTDEQMIDFHYAPTGNNLKVSIMLHETKLPHRLMKYSLTEGTHLTPEFRRINPNCKLPAIVDQAPADGGSPLPVFESGAILLYLAEKTGQLMPSDPRRRLLALQWLFWQVSALGPMLGQATHFTRYAPEGQSYSLERYMREGRRLMAVLEARLREAEYAAEEFSIADIACLPWASGAAGLGIGPDEYPAVQDWLHRLTSRPSFDEATASIYDESRKRFASDRVPLSPEEWSNMFGDRMHGASSVEPLQKV